MNMRDVPSDVLDPAAPVADADRGAGRTAAIAVALSALEVGEFATIHAVLPASDDRDQDLVLRLIEIGFIPGERVRVVAVGHPGRQPLAVRLAAADSGRRNLNGATFALRRHEADLIQVVPDTGLPAIAQPAA